MIRKLALAVLFMLGGLPLSVYGMGLGEIKAYSGLNQNFKAEIQLLSVPRGELDTMRVKLASREAFAKVGSEYMHILNRLKFEAVRRKDGSAVIQVTSNEAIREPFLDFLVEVNWPNGRMVKEYTVLLDPPLTTKRRSPGISKSRIATKKKAVTTPATPVKRTRPQANPQAQPATADSYGPVKANETAWKIAAKLKPQGVSIHQMMMALLHVNPQAFINSNVNLLKKGSMLRVPNIEEIKALDSQDAVASVQRQTKDWRANVSKTAPASATVDSSPDIDAVPQAEESQPVAVAEDGARLQIAAASMKDSGEAGAGETDAALGGDEEDIRHELMLARENMETSRLETEELKATVGELGSQLQEMTRLLTLQDEQLAQLRARMALLAGDQALAEDQPRDALLTETQAEPGAVMEQDQETSETAAINEHEAAEDSAVAETGAEEIAMPEEPLALATSTPAVAPVEPPSAETAAEPAEPEIAAAAEEPAEAETAAAQEPVEETADNSWQTSWVEDNLPAIAAGAGGLFAVGVLIALVRGRKKKALTDGIPPADDVMSASIPEPEPKPEPKPEPRPEPKPEPKPEPMIDSLAGLEQEKAPANGEYAARNEPVFGQDNSEVDTLAAADVYIAYSRYDQAQKTLEEEIAGGDRGVPVLQKLLEVYFATENVPDFVELAGSMVKDGQDKEDPQAWEHIRTMGKKLDKFNPLFWSPDSSRMTVEESELSLDIHSGTEEQDNTESLGELESLDLDMASYGMQDDSELDEAETGLDAELADLAELDNVTGIEARESTDESDEEIRFAEPLQDIELGDDMDTKLDLAKAYMEMGDNEAAESILKEVLEKGSGEQMVAASELRSRLTS